MTARRHSFLVAACAYIALSLACALAPSRIPAMSVVGSSLVGPPLLLVWGSALWPWYTAFTLALAGLCLGFARSRSAAARTLVVFMGVLAWLAGGFIATSMSI